MSDRKATLIFVGIVLFTLLMLDLSILGPEQTVTRIQHLIDQFLMWVFNK